MAEWREELLSGVGSVPKYGVPGRMIVFDENAEPILTGSSEEDLIMCAAELGEGRIVSFSQDGYVGKIVSGSDENVQTLRQNVMNWLSKGEWNSTDNVANLNDGGMTEEKLFSSKIAVWYGGNKERISSDKVAEFVLSGGALLHGMTPWGWLQLNSGKSLSDMPYHNVLITAGICYTDEYVSQSSANFLISENKASSSHLLRLLYSCSVDGKIAAQKGHLTKRIHLLPKHVCDTRITSAVNAVWEECDREVRNCIPKSGCPTKDYESKNLLDLWQSCVEFQSLKAIKAPGCEYFPGDFPEPPPSICEEISVLSKLEDYHSTGLYAPAGFSIFVEVVEGNANKNWQVIIGSHNDVLNDKSVRRWPRIQVCQKLLDQSYSLSSPFGGLIYLLSPKAPDGITIRLSDVVKAPQYILSDKQSTDDWPNRRQAPGLWADIIGLHTMFTLPSSSVRDIDDPSKSLKDWDMLVSNYHELRTTDVTQHRKQWIVADEQPCAGYMHAGYPIVTHLDVAKPACKEFLLTDKLKEFGNWGVFHEIGHNFQRQEWTFDGTSEVTCNIFTLYGMNKICNQLPWIHEWLRGHVEGASKYFKDGAQFEQWKSNPGLALIIYAQLARDFGWNTYQRVFGRYEKMSAAEKPKNNNQKMDTWFRIFSE